jgi:DNA-binding LacI/PurR family transcriptional regulator
MSSTIEKTVTLNDVAEASGVSYQTVSRVINQHPHVAKETRERVQDFISKLGYRPNRLARSLVTKRSNTIGVMSYGTSYFGPSQMLSNIDQVLRSRGYSLTFYSLEDMTLAAWQKALDYLSSHLVDGVIIIAPMIGLDVAQLSALRQDIPIVMTDVQKDARIPSVVMDQREGSRLAAQHLIDLGHRKIAEISGPRTWYDGMLRHESFVLTLQRSGLEPVVSLEGDWTAQSGYAKAKQLLKSGHTFTALITGNDQMALGAMRALREGGLKIPEDVSVVGFDDIPEASFFEPPLTTVRQDFNAMGQQSVEYLLDLLDQPETSVHQRVLYPSLVVRSSTQRR